MLKKLKIQPARLITILLLLLWSTPQVMASDFLLFYANDVQGETAPCG